MIFVFQLFDRLVEKLKSIKDNKSIQKFFISIDQRNEINILIVANQIISKEVLIDDLSLRDKFNLKQITLEQLEEDLYYYLKFEKEGDEVIDYKNSRRKLTNLLNPVNNFIPEIPVITYYSYKGGMGRSTNLVITTTYLARYYKKKIVIIDCDFEAPGFSNFFLEYPSEPRYKNGLMEYFFDQEHGDNLNLNDYSWEVSKEYSKNGEIRIIPAGNLDVKSDISNNEFPTHLSHYLEGLSRLDTSSTESILDKFKQLITDIKNQYNPDAIFIDSRTGFTDIYGIAALKLSTQVVGFFSNSVQNDPGIFQFITSIDQLIKSKHEIHPPIIVNSFSDSDFFYEFKNKIEEIIINNNSSDDSFQLTPNYFYFRYNTALSEIGTKREKMKNWLEQVDDKEFSKGYIDVAEKINEFLLKTNERNDLLEDQYVGYHDFEYKDVESEDIEIPDIECQNIECQDAGSNELENNFPQIQKCILNKLNQKWPNLYADSNETVDYQEEYDDKRIFYRDSMKDIFNFSKFIVLGNKGTGKSYLFQALKNQDITNELKRQAQKTNLEIHFLHLVDKKDNYFISTLGLESFKRQITDIGDFYTKFWKIYTWKSIIDKIKDVFHFETSIDHSFGINNGTENLKEIVNFIENIENIIKVEKELERLDKELNSNQIDIIAIYDNLDLMVEPIKWKDEMASLVSFWQFSNYRRIHSKLFLRSDLYKTIRGINNVQSLKNNTISIEWQKEEIFNYFFNLVKRYAKEEFILAVNNYEFKKVSNDAIEWKKEFEKRFRNEKQYQFDEAILRKLCWVFFGQYPDIMAHGESYDWLYKNVMNADETISIRPFLDLLRLSIDEYNTDYNKDSSSVLPEKYYTAKKVRGEAVKRHFEDLITEKGNQYLENIFDFIDKNEEYQYYQVTRNEFHDLLNNVILKNRLETKTTIEELEELLIINGIIKQIGNFQYSFAFLYKYRLGLKNKNKRRNRIRK